MRIAQVAIPIGDVARDDATPMDFQITSVALGWTTKQQKFQELGDTTQVINARLDMEIEKKEMYKEENIKLREYIARMRHENPTFISLIAVDRGLHFDHEAIIDTLVELGKWIEDVKMLADDFLT